MKTKIIAITNLIILFGLFSSLSSMASGGYTASQFSATPPLITDGTDPFVMINLSVELTQQAEAYTDGAQTLLGGTSCSGRYSAYGRTVGICYSKEETYLGYFDSNKCYEYVTTLNLHSEQVATGPSDSANPSYFKPVGKATNHECSDKFSGNFMNWATMTALDEFRSAMTGGARLVDTSGESANTLLTRTHRYGDWDFVDKVIKKDGVGPSGKQFSVDPAKVTDFDKSTLLIINDYSNSAGPVLCTHILVPLATAQKIILLSRS